MSLEHIEMKLIEKNIRAELFVRNDSDKRGPWFSLVCVDSDIVGMGRKDFKPWIESHVERQLRSIRIAAKLLRRYGFKVLPPSKNIP